MIAKRVILDIAIFISIFFTPWWIVFSLIIAGLFLFRDFYEAFAFSFILDSFRGDSISLLAGFHFPFSLASVILFFVIKKLKTLLL